MQKINVRIIPGKYDPEELKAMAIVDHIERKISHLEPEIQVEIYKKLVDDLEKGGEGVNI